MDTQRRIVLNSRKIAQHFRSFCAEMGMNHQDWTMMVEMYQVMMEGFSPDRLRACFTHKNTGKQLWFRLGKYQRKYIVEKIGS